MAFPVPAARTTYQDIGPISSHTISLTGLGTISAGDGLLMIVGVDGGDNIDSWDNFTELMQDEPETTIRIGAAYRVAVGGGLDANPTLTINGPEAVVAVLYRFAAADVDFSTDPPAVSGSTAATGSNTNPDPPACTPAGGADDYLWIAAAANDDDDATTAYPTNYTNGQTSIAVGSGGVNIGTAERQLNASTENPGTFTIAAPEAWAAITLAIYPTGGGSPQSVTVTAAAETEAAATVAPVASGAPQSIATNSTTETEAAVTVAAEQSGAASSGILALQAALE